MRRRLSAWLPDVVSALLVLWGLILWASPASAQAWDRYLKGYHGPYRGRVIDAETKQPLVGAAVVAIWSREKVELFHLRTVRYAVRETLTDANGEFFLSGEDVERNAPSKTLRPTFVIFYPGYGSFPRHGSFPQPPRRWGEAFEGEVTTVELPRLKTREERLSNLRRTDPFGLSENPFQEIPNFIDLVNREAVSLGLQPCLPQRQ